MGVPGLFRLVGGPLRLDGQALHLLLLRLQPAPLPAALLDDPLLLGQPAGGLHQLQLQPAMALRRGFQFDEILGEASRLLPDAATWASRRPRAALGLPVGVK